MGALSDAGDSCMLALFTQCHSNGIWTRTISTFTPAAAIAFKPCISNVKFDVRMFGTMTVRCLVVVRYSAHCVAVQGRSGGIDESCRPLGPGIGGISNPFCQLQNPDGVPPGYRCTCEPDTATIAFNPVSFVLWKINSFPNPTRGASFAGASLHHNASTSLAAVSAVGSPSSAVVRVNLEAATDHSRRMARRAIDVARSASTRRAG